VGHALGDCNIACTDLREVSFVYDCERSAAYYWAKGTCSGLLISSSSPGSALRCLPDCPFLAVVLPKVRTTGFRYHHCACSVVSLLLRKLRAAMSSN